jgi:hypothetical protein
MMDGSTLNCQVIKDKFLACVRRKGLCVNTDMTVLILKIFARRKCVQLHASAALTRVKEPKVTVE